MVVEATEDQAVAACHSADPQRWRALLDTGTARVADRFARIEPRRTAAAFVEELLSTERKTCWSLARWPGLPDPQPMQRLLRTAVRHADAVRDDTRTYLLEHVGHTDAARALEGLAPRSGRRPADQRDHGHRRRPRRAVPDRPAASRRCPVPAVRLP